MHIYNYIYIYINIYINININIFVQTGGWGGWRRADRRNVRMSCSRSLFIFDVLIFMKRNPYVLPSANRHMEPMFHTSAVEPSRALQWPISHALPTSPIIPTSLSENKSPSIVAKFPALSFLRSTLTPPYVKNWSVIPIPNSCTKRSPRLKTLNVR